MDRGQRIQLVLLLALLTGMIGILVILVRFYSDTAELTTLVVPADIFGCHTDSDCGLVNQIGCCPCEASGGQGAINTEKRAQLKAFLQAACTEAVPCVAVDVCREDARPKCVDGRCALVPLETS